RAYVTWNERTLPRSQVIGHLVSSAFAPETEVTLEAESPLPAAESSTELRRATVGPPTREGAVVTVSARLDAPGYLVLNEAYFPGVSASVDGKPLVVAPANHVVRAVSLPAGAHQVRFAYDTPGFTVGVAGSALGLLALLALVASGSGRD